jgi:hypothetical protein
MDVSRAIKILAGIDSKPEWTDEDDKRTSRSTRDRDLAYLRSKMPDAPESEIDLLRTMLVIMDTESVVGVNIFEEQPEDFDAFMTQYKLWDILKS